MRLVIMHFPPRPVFLLDFFFFFENMEVMTGQTFTLLVCSLPLRYTDTHNI
jgi:hypothetical protein